jgi:hypothetical protein
MYLLICTTCTSAHKRFQLPSNVCVQFGPVGAHSKLLCLRQSLPHKVRKQDSVDRICALQSFSSFQFLRAWQGAPGMSFRYRQVGIATYL